MVERANSVIMHSTVFRQSHGAIGQTGLHGCRSRTSSNMSTPMQPLTVFHCNIFSSKYLLTCRSNISHRCFDNLRSGDFQHHGITLISFSYSSNHLGVPLEAPAFLLHSFLQIFKPIAKYIKQNVCNFPRRMTRFLICPVYYRWHHLCAL